VRGDRLCPGHTLYLSAAPTCCLAGVLSPARTLGHAPRDAHEPVGERRGTARPSGAGHLTRYEVSDGADVSHVMGVKKCVAVPGRIPGHPLCRCGSVVSASGLSTMQHSCTAFHQYAPLHRSTKINQRRSQRSPGLRSAAANVSPRARLRNVLPRSHSTAATRPQDNAAQL